MNDRAGSIFLTFISVITLLLTSAAAYHFLYNQENPVIKETESEQTLNVEKENVIEKNENDNKAVQAGSDETALGKIRGEFLNPSNANTVYNNVYVKNVTKYPLDIASFLSKNPSVKFKKNDEPQVLIVHTHTNEAYQETAKDYYTKDYASRSSNEKISVVAVGKRLSENLNNAGFKTLHITTVHDKVYTGSYKRSAETIKNCLNKYPSIKLVIDLHRDSISGSDNVKIKPVVEINGKPSAQVMLVMCCGEGIEGFDNWQENLRFALKFQQTMEVMHKGLARSMHYLSYKYNQNLSTPSILLEVGTDANSVDEALNAADFTSEALISYLNTLV